MQLTDVLSRLNGNLDARLLAILLTRPKLLTVADLDRMQGEMPTAHPDGQWTQNRTLAQIGIHSPAHRARALSIGESLCIYRDYPAPKGCTSPFAPLWINELVRRDGG